MLHSITLKQNNGMIEFQETDKKWCLTNKYLQKVLKQPIETVWIYFNLWNIYIGCTKT